MKALPVWEIALPVNKNNGDAYLVAHDNFRTGVLEIARGYTMRPSGSGVWSHDTGEAYYDLMVPYRIACELPEFAWIVEYAFRLFSDQKAIYTEHAGHAVILDRDTAVYGDVRAVLARLHSLED